jgi:hypothetical protein
MVPPRKKLRSRSESDHGHRYRPGRLLARFVARHDHADHGVRLDVLRHWHLPGAFEAVFGSTTLPTAWTGDADADTVRRDIARRNPGVTVRVKS